MNLWGKRITTGIEKGKKDKGVEKGGIQGEESKGEKGRLQGGYMDEQWVNGYST